MSCAMRRALGRLVEDEQIRVVISVPDGEHLLLAAGELPAAVPQSASSVAFEFHTIRWKF